MNFVYCENEPSGIVVTMVVNKSIIFHASLKNDQPYAIKKRIISTKKNSLNYKVNDRENINPKIIQFHC